MCFILTLDWAINQRRTCVNMQKKIMWSWNWRRYEIIFADACWWVGSVRAESDPACSQWKRRFEGCYTQQPPVEQPCPRRSAKWGLENNTVCYGQEKNLWVSITVCLSLTFTPLAQLAGAVEYTASLPRNKDLAVSVLRMTLNNLMVRFQ